MLLLYHTAGNFGGTKFWQIANFFFYDWRVLIWQICGHVSLSMHMMAQNGRFLF